MSAISLRGIKVGKLPARLRGETLVSGGGDTGYIAGVVTELGIAVSRRVMCYHRLTGTLLGTDYSDTSGAYRFDGLIAGVKYFITSVDESNDGIQYNAVTQDLITASEVTA